jgi:hypothetical protein
VSQGQGRVTSRGKGGRRGRAQGSRDARGPARRLKATLERLQRLTGGYADALLALLPARAAALGGALGLEPARVQARRKPLGLRLTRLAHSTRCGRPCQRRRSGCAPPPGHQGPRASRRQLERGRRRLRSRPGFRRVDSAAAPPSVTGRSGANRQNAAREPNGRRAGGGGERGRAARGAAGVCGGGGPRERGVPAVQAGRAAAARGAAGHRRRCLGRAGRRRAPQP